MLGITSTLICTQHNQLWHGQDCMAYDFVPTCSFQIQVSSMLLLARKAVWSINTLFTFLLLLEAPLCLRTNYWVGLPNAPRVFFPPSSPRALPNAPRKMCQHFCTRHRAHHQCEADFFCQDTKIHISCLPCVLNGQSLGRKLQNEAKKIYLPLVTLRGH